MVPLVTLGLVVTRATRVTLDLRVDQALLATADPKASKAKPVLVDQSASEGPSVPRASLVLLEPLGGWVSRVPRATREIQAYLD